MGRLQGRIAFVTGAARMRGIGRATALRLAEEGADVAVCGRATRPEDLPVAEREAGWCGVDSLAEEIAAMGRSAVAIHCDITDERQVEAAFDKAVTALGVPDAIVNNAGYATSAGLEPIVGLSLDAWRKTIDVNLTGTFLVSRSAAKAMIDAGKPGAIVNLASITGRVAYPNFGGYCSAKFGVVGFTQQLALELAAHGIRVNCTAPGATGTDMMNRSFEESAATRGATMDDMLTELRSRVPMRRVSDPSEQASAIAFLLCDDAAYITGQCLNVNGGARLD